MRFLFLPLLTAIFYNYSFAQEVEGGCSTEDADSSIVANFLWYGNNEWLIQYVDSIEAPFNCTNCRFGDGLSRTVYQIPVNAVVYYNNSYPNLSYAQVEEYINGVNEIFRQNKVLIHLYLRCNIKRINSSKAYINSFYNTMMEI